MAADALVLRIGEGERHIPWARIREIRLVEWPDPGTPRHHATVIVHDEGELVVRGRSFRATQKFEPPASERYREWLIALHEKVLETGLPVRFRCATPRVYMWAIGFTVTALVVLIAGLVMRQWAAMVIALPIAGIGAWAARDAREFEYDPVRIPDRGLP